VAFGFLHDGPGALLDRCRPLRGSTPYPRPHHVACAFSGSALVDSVAIRAFRRQVSWASTRLPFRPGRDDRGLYSGRPTVVQRTEQIATARRQYLLRWLYQARHSMASSLARSVPEPQSSLGQSVLLGIRDGLPSDLRDDFRATGTSHLLAISGLHVGVLLAVSLGISQAIFGRRRHIYRYAQRPANPH
jgi:hypothetical protein